MKPEIPANGTTDDHRWKAMSVIERSRTARCTAPTIAPAIRTFRSTV
jgi:hypothetical protein